MTTTFQKDIDQPVKWLQDWLVNFNFEKFHIVHLGHKNPGIQSKLYDNGAHKTLKTSTLESDVSVRVGKKVKGLNFTRYQQSIAQQLRQQ
jgi:hypothetical protein